MHKKSREPKYDYSRVGWARRHAIRTLDDYQCTVAEIIAMFGCSRATFHRYDLDVRQSRRPKRSEASRHHEMSPEDAREIAVISLIRAKYTPPEIAEAIGISLSTVYREKTQYQNRLGDSSRAELRHIRRHLKAVIIDDRSFFERRLAAWRRGRRHRRPAGSRTAS